MAKITYLLGAGASANAMPTVAEMPIATLITRRFFERLLHRINSDIEHPDVINYKNYTREISRIIETLNAFYILLKNHSSVDTFFKRIFLTKDETIVVPTNRIVDFKVDEFLSIYNLILIFHEFITYLTPIDEYGIDRYYNEGIQIEEEREKIKYYLNSKLNQDLRYDTFFATILKNTPIKLPKNISILSWNYDIQLERSLLRFTKGSEISDINHIIKPDINYFKLNGSIWPNPTSNNSDLFDGISLNDCSILLNMNFIPDYILKFLRSIKTEAYYNIYNFNKNIFFQWDTKTSGTRSNGYLAVKETEVLVIIGYTFPTFNRDVDRMIYRSMQNLKKIYIVDLDESRAERIRTSIKSLLRNEENLDDEGIYVRKNSFVHNHKLHYDYSSKMHLRYVGDKSEENCKFYYTDIELITDVNQFHIPAEF